MAGFEKIDLDTRPSGKDQKGRTDTVAKRWKIPLSRRTLSILAGVLIFIGILSTFTVVLPAQATYKSALKTYRQAKLVSDAMKKQNVQVASVELAKTKVELAETQKNIKRMSYLRFVPLASWYYNDATHMLNAADHGIDAATIVIDSLKPYADVLGLKGEGSFVMGSAEERIKTAVRTMGKITPKIDDIAEKLLLVQKEVDGVSTWHYPSFIFGSKIQNQIKQMRELTDQGVAFVDEARPLIKVIPELLGEQKEKKYLILFQNDKELRPTGGFLTAYSIFNIDKGIIKVDRSDDIYPLDSSIANKPKAPEPILKYLPKVYTLNLRDSNLSPDYIDSMKDFMEMYNRAGQKVAVDGVVALDTHVLVNTIKILDDSVSASGITFTTKEDPRCKCPQVIYVLEDNISRPVGYVKEDRKGLIGSLMYAIMQKSLSSSPKLYWGPLVQTMLTMVNQKHILVYLFDKDAQSGVESLNAAGRIKDFKGDYLHINQANFAGGKANLFVKENVENSYKTEGDGTITKTVTVKYKNDFPPSDCNLERGGLCLNVELRDWFRVYVPKGSVLVESKGSQVKVTTKEEFGKTVFEGFLTVRPLGQTKLTITYKLPFKLKSGSPLPLLIQKQPGTSGNMYANVVNGRTIGKEFELLTDLETQLKI